MKPRFFFVVERPCVAFFHLHQPGAVLSTDDVAGVYEAAKDGDVTPQNAAAAEALSRYAQRRREQKRAARAARIDA